MPLDKQEKGRVVARELRLEDDERRVNRGGAAAKGRYALDRVLDFIAEEEALKERQEKARLEAEALRR